MDDTISRKAAIDAMAELQGRASSKAELKGISKAWKMIKQLPPVQPERIIHCKDCEWWTKQEGSSQGRCALSGMYPTGGWFCGNARMREVTT